MFIHIYWSRIPTNCYCFLEVISINILDPVLILNTYDCKMQPWCFHATKTFSIRCFMSLCPNHKVLPSWSYVKILVSLFLTELLLFVTFSTAVIQLPFDGYDIIWVDCGCLCRHSFLRHQQLRQLVGSIVVNFVCGYWSSCIGGFTFLAMLSVYRLFYRCVFQYMLLSIAAESQPFLFPIPPSEIAYVNTISTLINISFA